MAGMSDMASAFIYADGLRRDERLERLKLFGLSSPAILLVLVILVIPVGWLFFVSFIGADGQFSMENYERMITRKSPPLRSACSPQPCAS
jgi:putative spermidine/putrescine transport system permease protein